jgi:hypothetical protein
MRVSVRIIVLTLLFIATTPSLWALPNGLPCGQMKYEHHNMIDYGPLRISIVQGIAKDIQGFVIPDACVGVFSEADFKIVASGQTDSEGHFKIQNVPDGKYRLVITSDGFCAANAPVVLKSRSRAKKKLVVTMKPSGIDVCSFVELK